jgi:hypothetical protein
MAFASNKLIVAVGKKLCYMKKFKLYNIHNPLFCPQLQELVKSARTNVTFQMLIYVVKFIFLN